MAVLGNCVKFADLGQLVDPVRLPVDGASGFLPGILRKRKASGTDLKAHPRAAPREDGWEDAAALGHQETGRPPKPRRSG